MNQYQSDLFHSKVHEAVNDIVAEMELSPEEIDIVIKTDIYTEHKTTWQEGR